MPKPSFNIDGIAIGPDHPPYIIAEMSGNHNGDLDRAVRLIEAAKAAGADAVKLQTFTADSLTLDSHQDEFILKGGTWEGRRLYDLYMETHTPWDWHPALLAAARKIGITIFSSPFDKQAVQFLEELEVPAYKIASNEVTDWPLVEAVAKTGKPILMSSGVASRDDMIDTVDFVRQFGARDIAVLHCVSAYPAPLQDANIRTIDDIIDTMDVVPGFSDHTLGVTASTVAVARGACIIEKHFTLDRNDGGPDASFSLEPDELAELCQQARSAWSSLGSVCYGGDTDLKKKNIFSRQFWSTETIPQGSLLTERNVKSIRSPIDAGGIATRHFQQVYGKRAAYDIPMHRPVTWEDLDNGEQ